MSKIKVKLNHSGIKKFLHSKGMAAAVKSYADRAADTLGEGYKSEYRHKPSRVIASVYADTQEARRDNSENNSIIKAVLASGDRRKT